MADGNLPAQSSTGNLLGLLNLVKGSTTTTKSNISKQGMDQIIQQILAGPQGLAAISSGAKNAGVYNSTTQQLLTNDLVTRSAGELAKMKAGTTTKTPPKVGTKDVLGLLALSAGKSLAGPAVVGLGKKFGVDKLGDTIADKLGVGAGSDFLSNSANFAPLPESDAIDLFTGSGVTDSLASYGADLLGSFGNEGTDIVSSLGGFLSDIGGGGGGGDILDFIFG